MLRHKNDVQAFLSNEKIDVLLFSETHFTSESYFRIPGYSFYHASHPSDNSRGGAGLLVRTNITHHLEFQRITESIQSVCVSVKTDIGELKFAGVYCPPKHQIKFDEYSEFLRSLGDRFIVGGDWNAKHSRWGSRLDSTKGRELERAGRELGCDFPSCGTPTYWPSDPNKTPDVIDFFISKNVALNSIEAGAIVDLASDHIPITLLLSMTAIKKIGNHSFTNKNTDWKKFRGILGSMIELGAPINSTEVLDKEAEIFAANVKSAAQIATPTVKMVSHSFRMPNDILDMIKERRKARNKWHMTRHPDDKSNFNRLSNQLKRRLAVMRNERTERYLSGLSADRNTDYSLWKAIKYLKKPSSHSPPLKMADNRWAKSPDEKANVFCEHLATVFIPNPPEGPEQLNIEEEFEKSNPLESVKIETFSPDEVKNEIKYRVRVKKAPGLDGITGGILKELPVRGIMKLVQIYNAVTRLEHIPSAWKQAEVIMIHKAGKPPNEASSYRPISLLSSIGKLFERLYVKRLKKIVEERKIIPDHQFGFRTQHSTIEQVHRLTEVIEETLENKMVCSAVFLDVANAFDRVWHEGLLLKLYRLLPINHYRLLKSYLQNRSFRVRFDGAFSVFREIKAGVPQGSVLGPILFNIYTSDVPQTRGTRLMKFADDTAYGAKGRDLYLANRKLQTALNRYSRWYRRWRFALNRQKSVHIIFTNRVVGYMPIFLGPNPVPYSDTAKYLGLTLDTKLRWRAHVKKKRAELGLKYRKMYWLLRPDSKLSVDNKVLLYKQVLRPVWAYGSQLWGCTANSNLRPIQTFQNMVLRKIVGAPWYVRNSDIHRDLGVDDVRTHIKKIAERYEARLHSHPNIEAIRLLDNSNVLRRLKRRKPFELASDYYHKI